MKPIIAAPMIIAAFGTVAIAGPYPALHADERLCLVYQDMGRKYFARSEHAFSRADWVSAIAHLRVAQEALRMQTKYCPGTIYDEASQWEIHATLTRNAQEQIDNIRAIIRGGTGAPAAATSSETKSDQ